MKRSEINGVMRDAMELMESKGFFLPPFAKWRPLDWETKGLECSDIIGQQLGWDITDFGSGDYNKIGLLLFTTRNGTFEDLKRENGKIYAEKIMVVQPGQVTPTHFHYQKMEDIINRGGGTLRIRFWDSTSDERLGDRDVVVAADGVRRSLKAGGILDLCPGESVCIPQRTYHTFWGREGEGNILVGEVSRVNDDYVDNHFLDGTPRFANIDEDEEPLHLLFGDYERYYRHFAEVTK